MQVLNLNPKYLQKVIIKIIPKIVLLITILFTMECCFSVHLRVFEDE